MSRQPSRSNQFPSLLGFLWLSGAFGLSWAAEDPGKSRAPTATPAPELNGQILEYAREQVGVSVQDGECTSLVIEALKQAGATVQSSFEHRVGKPGPSPSWLHRTSRLAHRPAERDRPGAATGCLLPQERFPWLDNASHAVSRQAGQDGVPSSGQAHEPELLPRLVAGDHSGKAVRVRDRSRLGSMSSYPGSSRSRRLHLFGVGTRTSSFHDLMI